MQQPPHDPDEDAVMQRMSELELAAEDVEHQKRLVIELDRRRNMLREGSRALKDRAAKPRPRGQLPSGKKKIWLLASGGTFLRTTEAMAQQTIEVDAQETKEAIDTAHTELKSRVLALAQLEGPDSALAKLYDGFDLKPINK